MDHKAGNQLPHGWMMGFSTVQVENLFALAVFVIKLVSCGGYGNSAAD